MSQISLVTKNVYRKDLSRLTQEEMIYICGMTSKTWNTTEAVPSIHTTSDIESAKGVALIEPLMMHEGIQGQDRDEAFISNIEKIKASASIKIAWTEEQELLRWTGKQRGCFFHEVDHVACCNKYQHDMLSAYMSNIKTSILRTPINSEFYKPSPEKNRKVIAMGRVCSAKNIEGVIKMFELLPKDIEKVYIGNQSLWGSRKTVAHTELENSLQRVSDRWIPSATKEEVAIELATAMGYFNVSIYDVGCLSFLESAMSGCHCFAWRFHPMFNEYTQCHRFDQFEEGAALIAKVFDEAGDKPDMKMRAQVMSAHSYESFNNQLKNLLLEVMIGG